MKKDLGIAELKTEVSRLEKIHNSIVETKNRLEELGYEIVYFGLYGSQNYDLDLFEEGYMSDIDIKAIVLPSFDDFILGKKPVSKVISITDGQCDVKDIRLMFECFKKQNVNFIEILFTEFSYLNPKYKDLFSVILNHNEEIARLNEYQAIKCMRGMSLEKLNAMEHPYPTILWKIEKYGYDCYTDDTMFLTNSGWKFYNEITEADFLGTMNLDTGELVFQKYTSRIEKTSEDNIYSIETQRSSFAITENHNLLISRAYRSQYGQKYIDSRAAWKLEPLSNHLKKMYDNHIISFPSNGNRDFLEVSDEELMLMGLWVSDGSIQFKNKNHTVENIKYATLYQTDKGKEEYINQCRLLNLKEYMSTTRGKLEYTFHTSGKIGKWLFNECGHGSYNKKLPKWITKLSSRQALILLNGLMLGDGYLKAKTRNTYYTVSEQLANDVLLLGLLCGYDSVKLGPYNTKSNLGTYNIFHVQVKKTTIMPSFCNFNPNKQKSPNIKELQYSGKVVCFEVPNGTLVTMRNGKPATQGNCKQVHHIVRLCSLMRRYIDDQDTYASCLKCSSNNEKEFLLNIKRSKYSLDEAREIAKEHIATISTMYEYFIVKCGKDTVSIRGIDLLDDIMYKLIRRKFIEEIKSQD